MLHHSSPPASLPCCNLLLCPPQQYLQQGLLCWKRAGTPIVAAAPNHRGTTSFSAVLQPEDKVCFAIARAIVSPDRRWGSGQALGFLLFSSSLAWAGCAKSTIFQMRKEINFPSQPGQSWHVWVGQETPGHS